MMTQRNFWNIYTGHLSELDVLVKESFETTDTETLTTRFKENLTDAIFKALDRRFHRNAFIGKFESILNGKDKIIVLSKKDEVFFVSKLYLILIIYFFNRNMQSV